MKDFPSKKDIVDWIRNNPGKSGKREIGRAFGIKGAARQELKSLLRELQQTGEITRERKAFRKSGTLPPVTIMRVLGPDEDGDLILEPSKWEEETPAPKALYVPRKGGPALAKGDKILAKLAPVKANPPYEARLIRKLGGAEQDRALGIFRETGQGGRIVPIDKKNDREWVVNAHDTGDAKDGELVEIERKGARKMGLPQARIIARLGDPLAPKSISLIAIQEHGIPDVFPDEVVAEATRAKPVDLGKREDLRHLPLVTIDPHDARDHDDAIAAIADDDPKNEGGHILWVAIADVAHYVTPGSELDREARNRGNSSYFPDRVVPMLPDELSGDLCSLHEDVDRPCMALEIKLAKDGKKLKHRFTRALMRSQASLSYEQAQAGAEGKPDAQTEPLMHSAILPLWAAYEALKEERSRRRPLNLDLPERKIILSDDGKVQSVNFRERFDAHKIVEECMILANVCAAETLEAKQRQFLYRVHEEPSDEKLEGLRETAQSVGLTLAKGQVLKTWHLNNLLDAAEGSDHQEAVNISVLRSMKQAYYGPNNHGHFGLSLARYAHFTSPIRRYADLIVHRALIAGLKLGKDGITLEEEKNLDQTGTHISETERRSMLAERDTNDRYLSAFLSDRVGNEFDGSISGVARFGLFVRLDETGADGLIPASSLGREYFRYDEGSQTLTGSDSRRVLGLGMKVTIRLAEAAPITGGLVFELLSAEGKKMSQGSRTQKRGSSKKRSLKRRKKAQ